MSTTPDSAAVGTDRDGQNPDPLLDAAHAAAYLGLEGVVRHPAQAIRSLARKRRLRSTRVGGRVMVRRSWLEAYIQANSRETVVRET